MNTPNPMTPRPRQHPLLLIAALAVILFCGVGTAAIMGWLPSSHGGNRGALSDADRAALSAGLQQPGAAPPTVTTPATATPQPLPALPGQPVANAAQPGQLLAATQAVPSYTPPYTPAAGTPGSTAYGASGAQGATGSGSGDNGTSVTYASPLPERDANPPATHKPARIAEADGSNWCANCGNIEAIHETVTRARGSGVGAGAGAILGGLLGNQIGSGNGRSLATVAGAVGGAVMGNQVEGNMHAYRSYEIRVRLDDGTLRIFHQHSAPQWRTGDRVRIVKGTLRTA
jgi:outer membrane lipoprotein SlyB